MSVHALRPWGARLWRHHRAARAVPLPTPPVAAPQRRFLGTVPTCPAPTCACAATPAMPDGLAIDKEGKLNGLIASYAQQVLVCTGVDDWPSRIEDDRGGDNLAADLKELLGRGGTYSDPFHNVSVLNASFPSSVPPPSSPPGVEASSAYLLPSFTYVPYLPRVSFDAVEALVRGYLQPEVLHPAHAGLSPVHRDRLVRSAAHRALLPGARPVRDVLVLVCGHGGRDARCGLMGPALRAEFEAQLPRAGIDVLRGPVPTADATAALPTGPVKVEEEGDEPAAAAPPSTARVGLISHIGGHKFAGNVIVYLPPHLRAADGRPHPLAGHGVWYGRVEPRHVEGIVAETVVRGNVIADMFRGAIKRDGEMIRL